ncbi:MAG TPA: ABC transporter permease [Anaerolineales bacterium]|nr:ABC transporter permease [Anaerolineales bacterium]
MSAVEVISGQEPAREAKGRALWAYALQRIRRRPTAMLGLLIVLFSSLLALLAPWLAPHDPTQMTFINYLPPAWVDNSMHTGNPEYLLGTDGVGRDVLSRVIYGFRTAMFAAWMGVPVAGLLGMLVGALAAYWGGRLERWAMGLVDVFYAFPQILFAVLMALILRRTVFGQWLNGIGMVALSYALIAWVGLARLIRSNVLVLKRELFIEAAHALGATHSRILWRHILPNLAGTLAVWATFAVPRVILIEVLLSYIRIGIGSFIEGVSLDVMSWGGLFFEGRRVIHSHPSILLFPAIAITLVTAGFIFLGDGLRDALDPRVPDLP